jgi:hypothetical protein
VEALAVRGNWNILSDGGNRTLTTSLGSWPASTPENAIMFCSSFLNLIAQLAGIRTSQISPCMWTERKHESQFQIMMNCSRSKVWWANELHYLHSNVSNPLRQGIMRCLHCPAAGLPISCVILWLLSTIVWGQDCQIYIYSKSRQSNFGGFFL